MSPPRAQCLLLLSVLDAPAVGVRRPVITFHTQQGNSVSPKLPVRKERKAFSRFLGLISHFLLLQTLERVLHVCTSDSPLFVHDFTLNSKKTSHTQILNF